MEVFPKTKGWGSKRQPSLGLTFWTCLATRWLHKESTLGCIDQQESNKSKCATLLTLVSHKL